jgi:hypothetical protein
VAGQLETEYSVQPSPAQPTPGDILQKFKEKPINLEALFTGGNPFDEAGATHNKGVRSIPVQSRSNLPSLFF